jgi:hypothetical protein
LCPPAVMFASVKMIIALINLEYKLYRIEGSVSQEVRQVPDVKRDYSVAAWLSSLTEDLLVNRLEPDNKIHIIFYLHDPTSFHRWQRDTQGGFPWISVLILTNFWVI